jgi:sugar/nucleoside kinase (ribokinase family)
LAAPFVIDFFSEKLDQVLPYTDVVIANEFEGEAFGKKYFGIVSFSIQIRINLYFLIL